MGTEEMLMPKPSVNEIVETVKHSSLPTVFVEGEEDMTVFNRMERTLGALRACFLPCGDKNTLLEVFSRRAEFPTIPSCFVADLDMWFFSGPPVEYADVIFTSGYSIENDLYKDSNIERILSATERRDHGIMLREISRWFACEVEKYQRGEEFRSDPKLSLLIPRPGFVCNPVYLYALGFTEPRTDSVETILKNYYLSLRGKLLYEVIVRFTHAPGRLGGKYPYASLMELSAVDSEGGQLLGRIESHIRSRLGIPDKRINPQPELPVISAQPHGG